MSEASRIGIGIGIVVAVVVSACGKRDPAPVPEAVRMATSATVSASSSTPSSALSAPLAPSASPTQAPAAPPSRLHLVVEASYALTFIGGRGGGLLVDPETAWALELRGDAIVPAYGFGDGLSAYRGNNRRGNLEAFGGRYPKGVYAIVGAFALRGTTDHVVHEWRGGGTWRPLISSGNDMASVTAVEPYGSGLVAIVQRLNATELQAGSGAQFKPRAGQKSAECPARLAPVTGLIAPADGGLIAIGADCDGGGEALEVFGDDGVSKAFLALPDLREMRIAAPSTREIYLTGVPAGAKSPKASSAEPSASASAAPPPRADVALPTGKPVLLALQNGGWAPRPLPDGAAIESLDAWVDGSLAAIAGGAVWRRSRGGAWAKLALPEGASPKVVIAGSAAELWAVDQERSSIKVYGAKPPRWPFVIGAAVGAAPAPTPATPACASPFVLMYAVNPSTAGTDYDFPLTRAALKGHTELAGTSIVLTEHWQLGAFVPSTEIGEKLAGLIREKVKGQKPQVVCAQPRVRVEIPIDLQTGELKR